MQQNSKLFLWFWLIVNSSRLMVILVLIILVFLWLQVVITTLPLFLTGLLIVLVLQKNAWVFVASFLGGLILDASAVRDLGGTSLFLTCWLFLVLLYKRKYEIDTIPFVFFSSFFGIFSYLWLFGYEDVLLQAGAGSVIAVILFVILRVRSVNRNFQFSIYSEN